MGAEVKRMHGFRRTLRNAVLTQKQDSLHIISIQPVAGTSEPPSPNVHSPMLLTPGLHGQPCAVPPEAISALILISTEP